MSFSASVCCASTVTFVTLLLPVPSVRVGVKVSWYVVRAVDAFVRRTSEKNGLVAPLTCVTTGMISALFGGSDLLPAATGVTRLTDSGTLTTVLPPEVTVTVPVFAPGGRLVGFAVTVTVVPPGGIVPEDGVTVRYGLSVVALKPVSSDPVLPDGPGMKICAVTGCVEPNAVTMSAFFAVDGICCVACTTVLTVAEYAFAPQLAARTR